jgi:hypothetical protein
MKDVKKSSLCCTDSSSVLSRRSIVAGFLAVSLAVPQARMHLKTLQTTVAKHQQCAVMNTKSFREKQDAGFDIKKMEERSFFDRIV